MAQHSRNSAGNQELLSPAEAYQTLLHSAREADRRHVSGHSSAEGDIPDISFDGYQEDALTHEPVNLSQVLHEDTIDWNAAVPEEALDALGFDPDKLVVHEGEFIEDSYFPGYLDDAIQGKVPFGGEVLVEKGNTSVVEPMSLLEAFDRRVEHDQQQVKDRLGLSADNVSWSGAVAGDLDEADMLPVTDNDVMAAIAAVRIDKKIQNMPETELTKAIDSLTRAEIMNEYQRKFEIMQDMTKKIVGKLTVHGKESPPVVPIGPRYPMCPLGAGDGEEPKPLEIVTYIGSTRGKI